MESLALKCSFLNTSTRINLFVGGLFRDSMLFLRKSVWLFALDSQVQWKWSSTYTICRNWTRIFHSLTIILSVQWNPSVLDFIRVWMFNGRKGKSSVNAKLPSQSEANDISDVGRGLSRFLLKRFCFVENCVSVSIRPTRISGCCGYIGNILSQTPLAS